MKPILKHDYLNEWKLFWLCFVLLSIPVLIDWSMKDTSVDWQLSSIITTSVRVSVPWLFMAFAASSLASVWPNSFSKWLMRNRRIFGLLFAAGMMWQLFFIVWLVTGFTEYYMEESYTIYAITQQMTGYVFIFAMGITSFDWGRKLVSPKAWRVLHKTGIYILWATVWNTYWAELYYYEGPNVIDYIYCVIAISVWLLRVYNCVRKKAKRAKTPLSTLNKSLALGFIGIGFALLLRGQIVSDFLYGNLPQEPLGGWLDIFVPQALMVSFIIAAWFAMHRPKPIQS